MSLVISPPSNLADPRLGAEVVSATDDFFADKARLIAPEEPVFKPGVYDANGKWMDGWESRRKRGPGHDSCIVRLARPGVIEGAVIDTRHFTGNYPPAASLEACACETALPPPDADWSALTGTLALQGDHVLPVTVSHSDVFTHVRLNIFPDGGVARLRIYGRFRAPLEPVEPGGLIDLAAARNGGRAVACNDAHFGVPANLIMPGRAANMGEGWETRRRREPGHDWAILELGAPGVIAEAVVDTHWFKGNFPDRCSLQAAPEAPADPFALAAASESWPVLLPEQKLEMDRAHTFRAALSAHEAVRYVRLNIFPDGGVSRLRLLGRALHQ